MLSVNYSAGKAHPEYILNQKIGHHRLSVFAGNDFMFIYTYKGDLIHIDMKAYMDKEMDGYFMNPENNSMSYFWTFINQESIKIRPTRRRELSNDWVIVFKEKFV